MMCVCLFYKCRIISAYLNYLQSVYDDHNPTTEVSQEMKQLIHEDQLLPLIYEMAKTIIPGK